MSERFDADCEACCDPVTPCRVHSLSSQVIKCEKCGSTERVYRDCWNCDGEGYVEDPDWENETGVERCHHCDGHGGYFLCANCAPPERDPNDDRDEGPE